MSSPLDMVLGLTEEQQIFNNILILKDTIKDQKNKIENDISKDIDIVKIDKKIEKLNEELKALKDAKKGLLDKFKAENEDEYNTLDSLKIKLEGRKESLTQRFLENFKKDSPTILYKEKNGKKVKIGIVLSPKFKNVKTNGDELGDEFLKSQIKKMVEDSTKEDGEE